MADVTIESGLFNSLWSQWQPGNVVWTGVDTGYVFFGTQSGPARGMHYRKTTDGGATWGSAILLHENADDHGSVFFACWYDRWTPGDDGRLIHIAWLDNAEDSFRYRALDTSDGSLGDIVDIEALTAVAGGSSQNLNDQLVALTKTRGGTLAAGYMNVDGPGVPTEGFHVSADGGATWTSKAHPLDGAGERDLFWLFPANLEDHDDLYALYLDVASFGGSANELTLKTYAASADGWSESATLASDVYIAGNRNALAPAFRPSDGAIWVAYTTDFDSASADLRVLEIEDATTWTQHPNVIDNTDDWGFPVIAIDDGGGAAYVFYVGQDNGAQAILGASCDVHYVTGAIDTSINWGFETSYSETPHDYRRLYAPLALVARDGGRIGVAMIDDDADDLIWNEVNSIAVAAVTPPLGAVAVADAPLGGVAVADAPVGAVAVSDASTGG